MNRRTFTYLRLVMLIFGLLAFSVVIYAEERLFDAHLHFNAEDASQHQPERVVALLRQSGIDTAVVTSRPPSQVLRLHALAPDLIVPMLGVYRTAADKQRLWLYDKRLPARVESALSDSRWQAIGELHVFALDRHNPVFIDVVKLAEARHLPLLIHSDPAVIDALFQHAPDAKVIWAHAGAYPLPELLRDYLQRYPNLYVDLSVREERVAPQGEIDTDWEWLLVEFSDRFLIGVDTYRTSRWDQYPDVLGQIRNWLDQLPTEVARNIGSENGKRLFRRTAPQ